MKKIAVIIFFALFSLCCASCRVEAEDKSPEQLVREAKASITELSVGDVRKMIDARENIILLDVRDKHEFAEGHIAGAINISRGTLEFKVTMIIPDKSARIVVYCGLDLRGPLATRTMNELGYKEAVNMVGGLKAWEETGYPTVKQPVVLK